MSRGSAEGFDPFVWKRRNGFLDWAALTAMCLSMRPRWSIRKCAQVLHRIVESTEETVPADIGRDLLHWLWVHRRYDRLLHACNVLQTRDLGTAWGLPGAYREAVALSITKATTSKLTVTIPTKRKAGKTCGVQVAVSGKRSHTAHFKMR